MTICLLIQPDMANAHWTSLYIRGVRQEAKSRGDAIVSCESDGTRFPADAADAETVLCVGASAAWMDCTVRMLTSLGKRAILVGASAENGIRAAGYVSADHAAATEELLSRFSAAGKSRVALLGINGDSANDRIKQRAFEAHGGCRDRVFFFRGQMRAACEELVSRVSEFDAVICTNSVTALMLVNVLKHAGVSVPEDLSLACFADRCHTIAYPVPMTVAQLDCVRVGRLAVPVYAVLSADPGLSAVSVTDHCEIRACLTAGTCRAPDAADRKLEAPVPASPPYDLYADEPLSELMAAEALLAKCDALDLGILSMLRSGRGNAETAETLYTSESTVKYRIRRMLRRSGAADRAELIRLLDAYWS